MDLSEAGSASRKMSSMNKGDRAKLGVPFDTSLYTRLKFIPDMTNMLHSKECIVLFSECFSLRVFSIEKLRQCEKSRHSNAECHSCCKCMRY